MANKVTLTIDTDSASMTLSSGRLFLGTQAQIRLDGWSASTSYTPVLTLYIPNSTTPIAQSTYSGGVLTLDLTGASLRKLFRIPSRMMFLAYLNQRMTKGEYLPAIEAEGFLPIDWSPESFEVTDDTSAFASFRGPAGADGAAGKSAYQLAVENGYTGSLKDWLREMNVKTALTDVSFDASAATMRTVVATLKTIVNILGGSVQ